MKMRKIHAEYLEDMMKVPVGDKPEVFGVIWIDRMFGPLCLTKPTAEKARALALEMVASGSHAVTDIMAVHIPAGTSELIDLLADVTSEGNHSRAKEHSDETEQD